MKRVFLIIFLIFVLLFCILTGYWIGNTKGKKSSNFLIKAIRSSQNGLINPLVEYEIGSEFYSKTLKLFREDVIKEVDQNIKDGNVDKVALYFRSLNNGPWFGIKEDENFFPASLLKVPLMIAYYKWSESDPSIFKKEVTYDQDILKLLGDYNEVQYYKSENPIIVGQTYTIKELIDRMIANSDNNAKNLLILNLDKPERLFNIYTDLGIVTPPELKENQEDIFSVHEYGTFLRILYNASYLSKENSKEVLELLIKTKFNLGITAKLPSDIKIAHKFGEHQDQNNQYKQLHDCGIIYYPSYPYLLCIMTRGNDFEKMEGAIQDISLTVYQEIDKQIKRGEN